MIDDRYPIHHPEELLSPSLLLFAEDIRRNLDTMIDMAGGAERLRPHVKTHKMPAIIHLAESRGIHKHKVATIAEAEMVASTGGMDVLVSYPIVGSEPRAVRSSDPGLSRHHLPGDGRPPGIRPRFVVRTIPGRTVNSGVLVDLEVGMGRTGIAPGDPAAELYALIAELPNLEPDGLHAYDGQIRDLDLIERRRSATPVIEAVHAFRERLLASGFPVPRLVLGGTPTFPIHARDTTPGVECSPGTCVLHDMGYAEKFPDLPFKPAAILFTRVVSQPRPGRICLDLGHKAIAADPVGPRLKLLGLPDATLGGQSEEHLVVEAPGVDALDLARHCSPSPPTSARPPPPFLGLRDEGGQRRGSLAHQGPRSSPGNLILVGQGKPALRMGRNSVPRTSGPFDGEGQFFGRWLPIRSACRRSRSSRTPRLPRALSTRSPSRPVRMPQPP